MKTKKIQIILGVLVLYCSAGTWAAVEIKTVTAARLLTDPANYGYCMVYSPQLTFSVNCPGGWVSLDCKGSYHSKETSRLMWDAANLAYATESNVYVVVNDARGHNGYCVADRLDVVK